ncbi:hypothetical protein [Streptomyces broussonetiae]|uniref:Uncharacterized protein n=1 Tax=Streptomyces broussonetiae TaxID=2686304 RepID=A0A6I6NGA4_9ACTN|nr:hypothetical protein [Streptomyces broussonetiae]QHA09220.1 hypothetical protein GQF42_43940 [Streptomyces broussonetiae]
MSTGDSSDLVAAVVAALVQAASSAAGAAGTTLGAEAIDWVRTGLGQLPRWTQAAERVGTAPDDEQAQQDLAKAVDELLSLNPGLAQALESRLTQPGPVPPPPTGPPTITIGEHARIGGGAGPTAVGAGNNVAGRDVRTKVTNKRSGIGVLIAALVVMAALIALSIHFVGRSSNQHAAKPLTNMEQVKAVLPDLHALPAGWQQTQPALASPSGECIGAAASSGPTGDLCRRVVASASARFDTAEPGGSVFFMDVAGPSTSWADQMYDQYLQHFDDGMTNPVNFPAFGDRSSARQGAGETSVLIRTGTVVASVVYTTVSNNDASPSANDTQRARQTVIPLASMITTRAQQAQAGQTPTASAR